MPPPNLLRSFEGMSSTSISGILLNARMDSVAGVKDARDVLLGSFSYAFEGICVSDVRTEPKRVGLQAFSARVAGADILGLETRPIDSSTLGTKSHVKSQVFMCFCGSH